MRRVALVDRGAGGSATRSGSDVIFAVDDTTWEDYGGVSTRLGGRVWRWDLTRDAYIGLANADGQVFGTSVGTFYRARDGFHRWDPSGPTPISWPSWPGTSLEMLVIDGTTYAQHFARVMTLRAEGTTIVETDFAELPGNFVFGSRGVVISAVRTRDAALHVLRLPARTPTVIPLEPRFRRPNGASWVDADTIRITGWHQPTLRLDLRTFTLTEETAPPPEPVTLRASSLRTVAPTTSGLFVASSRRGFELDARGATPTRRTTRTAISSLCSCEGAALVCRGARVEDACSEVPELDYVAGTRDPTSTLYTRGGVLRIDRLEVDLVRVTRLRDGARMWVRVFGDALFAQLDDGTYYLSDRSLEATLTLRDGGTLAAGPLVPLASRADALYRATLIADFFAAP